MTQIFISYRRKTSTWCARSVYEHLKAHGYDVFMDVENIDGGKFDPIILHQIKEREYFIVILESGCLSGCTYDDGSPNHTDWLRREIEHALEHQRAIIPLLVSPFIFTDEEKYLTGRLEEVKDFNGPTLHPEYFDACMQKLKKSFLGSLSSTTPLSLENKELFGSTDVVSSASMSSTTEDQLAQHLYEQAFNKLQAGDFNGATADYTNVIHHWPRFAPAYGHRGVARKRKVDINGAISDYTRAIEFSRDIPYYAEYYYHNRGIAFNDIQEYEKAIDDFTQAIYLNPQLASAFVQRGIAWLHRGDLTSAFNDFLEAIELDPQNPVPFVNKGAIYAQQGAFELAITEYTTGITLFSNKNDPDLAKSYHNRGLAYAALERWKDAIDDYTEALNMDHSLYSTYASRAYAWEKLGKLDHAIKDCNVVIGAAPDSATFSHRGWLNYLAGDYLQAEQDYVVALNLDPDHSEAHNNFGLLKAEQNQIDAAISYYTRAIELNHPQVQWPYTNRATQRLIKGDLSGAFTDSTEAIRYEPKYANAYVIRAHVREALDDPEGAVGDYRKYLELGGGQRYNTQAEIEDRIRLLEQSE